MATPGQILNIGTGTKQNRFKLQTAFPGDGAITEISCASLASGYTHSPEFIATSDSSAVKCYVREDAPLTSSGAGGPRTELREMDLDGTTEMAFTYNTQTHWIRGQSRVVVAPDGHLNGIVIAQMHDDSNDNIEICTQLVSGKIALVVRINGTSAGIPKLSTDYQPDINTPGPWFDWKIEVGSFGWRIYFNNFTTPFISSTDPGMPALTGVSGGCYFKAGTYTQCKDTDIVDPTRYPGVELRNLMHFHTGWPDPSAAAAPVAVSNVRFGAAVATANTGATSGAPLTITSTAAFPTAGNAPVAQDLLLLVSRVWRSNGANNPSTPSLDATTASQGWVAKSPSTEFINIPSAASPTPTNTVTHSIRHRIWYLWYTAGMAAPVVTYNSGSATDVFGLQLICMTGTFFGGDPFDQYGTLTAATTASTTVIGPAPALTNPVVTGGAVFVLLEHENALSSGAIPTVTGDGLTWSEGLEYTGVTPAAGAFATDWALVPAATSVTAKQATIATTSGKGVGHMFSIKPFVPFSDVSPNQHRNQRMRPLIIR